MHIYWNNQNKYISPPHYERRDTTKKAADVENMGLLVDAGTTSYTIRDVKKFKNYNQTFQPENHYIKLVDVYQMQMETLCWSLSKIPPTRTTYFL